MVCTPTRSAGSPTGTGTHICTKAGGSHDESMLTPSPHLSLEVDWVAGEPNAGSCNTERTDYHHRETEEFVGQISPPVNLIEELAPALLLQNYYLFQSR
jgi:hypothetical protein